MTERLIVDAIRRLLTKRGAWHIKTTGVAVAGIPDILACHHGHFLAIEVKQPGRRARPLQTHQLNQITNARGTALVATSADQVAEILDRLDQVAVDHLLNSQEASP